MHSLKIRPATVNDIPSIVEIRGGAITEEEISEFDISKDSFYTSVDKLREMWDFGNKLKDAFEVFVAEVQGKVVGFIVFAMKGSDNIDNIIVAKDQQGRGVGRALVEYVESLAISGGFDVIGTDTIENANGVAWKSYGFWIRMGYEDTGERVASDFDFKNIPFVKKLH